MVDHFPCRDLCDAAERAELSPMNTIIGECDPLSNSSFTFDWLGGIGVVVSAANTTVHGAGCFGVPTIVILAKDPDWRWLGDENSPCYWYPSVKIARQSTVGAWDDAIEIALKHLS